MKVAVILPTYNERETIITLLTRLAAIAKSLPAYSFYLLVVDDNSPDGTTDLIRAHQKTHTNVFLLTGQKEGLGKAILRGMRYCVDTLNVDTVIQMDADLSHDPDVIPAFLKKIEEGADFVVGSRYIPGGSIPDNWAPHRKLYSIVGNAIVRYGLGYPQVHDWTGGFRAYAPKYVKALDNQMPAFSGYVFQIAFLHRAILLGAKVKEVPIHFADRRFGHSKIAPSEYIRNVFLYVGRARMRSITKGSFGKFLVVGTIGFIINTVLLEVFVHVGFHPTVGSIVGAEFAIISNFFLNNFWTFKSQVVRGKRLIVKLLQFNTTSVGAILIQAASVFIGTHLFGLGSYRVFYILGVGIGLVYNYMMYSKVIWKKSS